jgi:hypothetical protein
MVLSRSRGPPALLSVAETLVMAHVPSLPLSRACLDVCQNWSASHRKVVDYWAYRYPRSRLSAPLYKERMITEISDVLIAWCCSKVRMLRIARNAQRNKTTYYVPKVQDCLILTLNKAMTATMSKRLRKRIASLLNIARRTIANVKAVQLLHCCLLSWLFTLEVTRSLTAPRSTASQVCDMPAILRSAVPLNSDFEMSMGKPRALAFALMPWSLCHLAYG